jgi:15-cis-phytoene desaturase
VSLPPLASIAPRVAILGGGIAGLSCAHELARQGLRVDVYEASASVGGKARSQYVAGTGEGGRRDLPGEHGFRFYPAFYRHVIATMQEIHDPLSPTGTVAGNLVAAPQAAVALPDTGVLTVARRPRTPREMLDSLRAIYKVGGSASDLGRYLGAHLEYLTSSDARRDHEIDRKSWAAFIGADEAGRYGEAFREVLLACTRTMVAMDAKRGSSRTIGKASSLLLTDSFGRGDVDRTMMGPTTECWLDPWSRQLERWGVRFHCERPVLRIDVEHGRVERAWTRAGHHDEAPIEADAFVLAVPLEVAHRLAAPLAAADPALLRLAALDVDAMTDWMVGAQFFLREDLPLCDGHLFFPSSPWSLTAISQAQFWNRGQRGMDRYGDGRLGGILSVDVSSCFTPDADGVRLVDETTREGILRRILRQILDALDAPTRRKLEDAVYAAHLDAEVKVGPGGTTNAARLLVHPPGSWAQRPDTCLRIPNLFLAGDYVRTAVDLASMEGANEAGRRAAQGVLRALGLDDTRVKLFALEPPDAFRTLRRVDAGLYEAGLPHVFALGKRLVGRFTGN